MIEADPFEDLPIIHEITGSAGHTFWEKLGFHLVNRHPHPDLREPSDFVASLLAMTRVGTAERLCNCPGRDAERSCRPKADVL